MMDSQKSDPHGALGTQLTLLSSPVRRALLGALAERSVGPTTSYPPLDLLGRPDASERFRLELYHSHLPKLAANGFIHWDSDAGTIRKGPDWEDIVPLLELLSTHREKLPDGGL